MSPRNGLPWSPCHFQTLAETWPPGATASRQHDLPANTGRPPEPAVRAPGLPIVASLRGACSPCPAGRLDLHLAFTKKPGWGGG